RALIQAGREAAWWDARVIVVHVFHRVPVTTPMAYVPASVEQSLKTAAEEAVNAGVHFLSKRYPGMAVESAVVAGPAGDALAEIARDAGLLVLGNRGRGGFSGLLLGSVSLRALGLASCPTMIVRGTLREPVDAVVLALDIEDPAEELIDFAFADAARRGARLRVVNAWDLDWAAAGRAETDQEVLRAKEQAVADVRSAVERLLNPRQAAYPGMRLDIEVADGSPSAVLTEATRHADLIVAGAHRRGDRHSGMRLGPVAQTLLHHADCPVVVVPRA
ncbi:MAG: universal stress protein, partial [Catenulispora sp.]|nr:universal stress protein [Catenulispora sp.]